MPAYDKNKYLQSPQYHFHSHEAILDGTRAKYVIFRWKIADSHGYYGYHGNSSHDYKENVEFVSKQNALMIRPNHQVCGYQDYSWLSA